MSEKTHTHVDALRDKYDKAVESLKGLQEGSGEYARAREAKRTAFVEWNEADQAQRELEAAKAVAEQKQAAADAAAADAKAAVKAASTPPHGQVHPVRASTVPHTAPK